MCRTASFFSALCFMCQGKSVNVHALYMIEASLKTASVHKIELRDN